MASKYNGTANLIPYNKLSESEQKELTSKGGKASGKARRERKQFKDILLTILSEDYKDNPNLSNAEVMNMEIIKKALKGDKKAYELVRDGIGEMPVAKVKLDNDSIININVNDEEEKDATI